MSKKSWLEALQKTLRRLKSKDPAPRIAILGIGHERCGDDAVGLIIVQAIQSLRFESDRVLAICAGAAPENFTGTIRRFSPDLVILIDAADMQEKTGTVRWLAWNASSGLSASTHTLPLHILATYLTQELSCIVVLLGIQPGTLSLDAQLSPEVNEVVQPIVDGFARTLWSEEKGIIPKKDWMSSFLPQGISRRNHSLH